MRTLILPLLLLACGTAETPAPAPMDEAPVAEEVAPPSVDVDAVAAVAKKIRADPSTVDAILADAGMSQADLRSALFAIAESAELTAAYEAKSR